MSTSENCTASSAGRSGASSVGRLVGKFWTCAFLVALRLLVTLRLTISTWVLIACISFLMLGVSSSLAVTTWLWTKGEEPSMEFARASSAGNLLLLPLLTRPSATPLWTHDAGLDGQWAPQNFQYLRNLHCTTFPRRHRGSFLGQQSHQLGPSSGFLPLPI